MGEQIVVLATKNEGKIKEIKSILSGEPVRIMGLGRFWPHARAGGRRRYL